MSQMNFYVTRIHNGFLMKANFLGHGGYETPPTFYPTGKEMGLTLAYMAEHAHTLIEAVERENKRRTAKDKGASK